jgi:hypothetical protein
VAEAAEATKNKSAAICFTGETSLQWRGGPDDPPSGFLPLLI